MSQVEAEEETQTAEWAALPGADLHVQSRDLPDRILRREARYRRRLAFADALAAACVAVLLAAAGGDDLGIWLLITPLLIIFVTKLSGGYDRDRDRLAKTTLEEAPTLFQVGTIYAVVLGVGAPVFYDSAIEPRQLLAAWVATPILLTLFRTISRRISQRLSSAERCVLVGTADAAERVRRKLAENQLINAEVVGRVALVTDQSGRQRSVPALIEELHDVIERLDVDRIIIAPTLSSAAETLELIRYVKAVGVRVSLLPRLFEVVGSAVRIDELDGITLLGLREYGLSRSSYLLKRSMDLAISGSVALVAGPAMIAIAILIRLDSRGPVFFRQPRVGRNGREFEMLKYRSMVTNAEDLKAGLLERNEAGDGLFKLEDDPRVTRIGALLRATSLDELPQILNVLRGDMSLVGPRPLVPEDDENIRGLDRRRLVVPPGMTGPWQLLGSIRVPMEEMVKIDYLYAANWSLWADVKIIVRTIPLVYGRRGV